MRLVDADKLKAKQQEDADLFIGDDTLSGKSRRDEALNAVANIVNAPTVDLVKHEQWVLCDEQLPNKKGYYLTSDRFGVTITQWNGKGWIRTSVVTITEYGRSVHHEPPIIAWMPLPKPYGR